MSAPWMKFYPADWRSDPRLRMCSMAARGLWIEMLALMHEATPYGHLLVAGTAPTDTQLAVLAGSPSDDLPALLVELEAAGVFSRTRSGVIYSRRMTRDEKKSALARKNGKNGGNPSIRKQTNNPPPDKGQHNGRDKTQKPDTRSQIPERRKIYTSELTSERADATPEQPFEAPDRTPDQDRFGEFWDAYPLKANAVKAEAAWITAIARGAPAESIILGAKAYAASRQGEDPKFTPQPARWIEDRRWTDQHQAPPAAAPSAHSRRMRALAARFGGS